MEMWAWPLGWEDPLEEEVAPHSSILTWRIPWIEEPGGLQYVGSQRVRHDWSDAARMQASHGAVASIWREDEGGWYWVTIYTEVKRSYKSYSPSCMMRLVFQTQWSILNFQSCSELARTPSVEDLVRWGWGLNKAILSTRVSLNDIPH